jgi:hypothetical protein
VRLRILDTRDAELGWVDLTDGRVTSQGWGDEARRILVVKPGVPDIRLTENDGEAWLRGLQAEFRSGFVRAVLEP